MNWQIIKELLDIIARFIISLALLYFAYVMRASEGATTLSTAIATGVLAGWLQQQTTRRAERPKDS